MKIGLCKLCAQERALAKAHIVPKAFYSFQPNEPLMLFSGAKDYRPKRSPIGIYDDNLLCERCEDRFSSLDSEAARILKPWPLRSQMLKDEDGFILKADGRKGGYIIGVPDTGALLPFFHFLLWRMGETSRPEMRLELEAALVERLRASILFGAIDEVGLRIYATRSRALAAQVVVSPRMKPINGDPVINIDFGGFQFIIKFDDDGIDEFALAKDRDWIILFSDFRTTKLYESMKSIVQKNPIPWARLRTKRQ